jgi:ubiquinone/menaquinone biosynthesis C-methylase UbiE
MNNADAWSDPSQASPEDVTRMAEHLEERSQRPDMLHVNQAVCDALQPQPGERLLEVGCGTGIVSRLVAPYLTKAGAITGLDISPQFLAVARQHADLAKPASQIRFVNASGAAVPYTDGCFDGAWGVRLLLHVVDPDPVVSEMRRVVRPGGRVVLADWDFETTTVDHPDRELTRRILNWRTDHHGANNWSGRQLLRLGREAGLKDVQVYPLVVTAIDERPALTQSLWRAAEVARDGGAITEAERYAWVSTLKERISSGRFFASMVYFIVKGWK